MESKWFMTIREAARVSGISAYTLRRWKKEGKLPYIMRGNRVLVDMERLKDDIRKRGDAD